MYDLNIIETFLFLLTLKPKLMILQGVYDNAHTWEYIFTTIT